MNNAHCSFPIYCHITEQALLLSGNGDLTIWNLSSPWSTLSLMGCLMLAVSDFFREWCSPLLDFLYERCEELLSPCEVDRVGENSVEVLRDCWLSGRRRGEELALSHWPEGDGLEGDFWDSSMANTSLDSRFLIFLSFCSNCSCNDFTYAVGKKYMYLFSKKNMNNFPMKLAEFLWHLKGSLVQSCIFYYMWKITLLLCNDRKIIEHSEIVL